MFETIVALFIYMAIAVASFVGGYLASRIWMQHKTFRQYKRLKSTFRQYML